MLAKKIATPLYAEIVDKFENEQLRIGHIYVTPTQEPELNDYNIRKIVLEISYIEIKDQAIEMHADFDEDARDVVVYIGFNFKRFSKNNYEFLSTELRNIIGHEIEHASNTNSDSSIPPSTNSDYNQNNALMQCVYGAKYYLINTSEKNAYIRECMTRSKNKGILLEDMIEDLIRNTIFRCNPEEIRKNVDAQSEMGIEIKTIIAEVMSEYQDRINQIYSNRKERNR